MLKLTKKGDKYWLFEDSEIGLFSPSKFTINLLNNVITIVYENGLKSKTYNVIDCEIYDLGSLVPFTTSSGDDFMAKLEELNCPCFQKNENIYIGSGGTWSDLTDFNSLTDATTPLSGTEEIPIVQSGVTKKVAVSEIAGGATPSLQDVTDVGNTTTNDITIGEKLIFTAGAEISDDGGEMILQHDLGISLRSTKDGFQVNFISAPIDTITDNVNVSMPNESGIIATREWVNAKNNLQWLVKDTTPTTAVTGTTSRTQIGSSILIPDNTFSTEDVMILDGYAVEKGAGIGTCQIQIWHNTSDTLTGATAIAVFSMANANVSAKMVRTFEISEGLLKCRINGTTNAISDIGALSFTPLSISFDPTIDNYFFTTVNLGNASDSVTRTQLLISK
ncbi:hypothetical protein HWC97_gp68 [Flavobacterium phage vB_FspS_snusmum6-1]|uniref:Uncharacterized protein n=5 Tax=Muminvirus TaxID=2843426 RepID=A0A6B9LEL1_9CAUD|nr:hypothetical protein HWC97_gp68 [Flavobacterium phage vB_FspS_snusmum6-1]QHB39737.1 hypothetical protein mumin62_gp063 [Flavobacterium phage vB_FspS_mumin6-2]QHB39803.1 hypothetical protein mumin63_gp062 [Flavobacterium phage vB_FspS_mumin6-3]QHB40715.1 hypothetical protein snusmum62_gp069 [Flavobacterium phage vB_FspS_snusmum6-2]QHB40787.1 hypothetical protein snusmum63_gp068 [Flavobacterium phage vB_FspS_snusmum6-3]QHB40858.1 hypothetical protein snusmum91_gp067 [Flavobacterium phage vB_F